MTYIEIAVSLLALLGGLLLANVANNMADALRAWLITPRLTLPFRLTRLLTPTEDIFKKLSVLKSLKI